MELGMSEDVEIRTKHGENAVWIVLTGLAGVKWSIDQFCVKPYISLFVSCDTVFVSREVEGYFKINWGRV